MGLFDFIFDVALTPVRVVKSTADFALDSAKAVIDLNPEAGLEAMGDFAEDLVDDVTAPIENALNKKQ